MAGNLPYHPEQCEQFMRAAMDQARSAEALGEVPVGCVIVREGSIIAAAGNRRETRRDPTAHAEMIALQEAARRLGTWYLDDCVLFVTLEPCPMCAGAIVNARLAGLVYGAADPKAGACETFYSIPEDPRLNHTVTVVGGVLAAPCGALLTNFFRRLRKARQDG
jgi:tRNA(adenine34) deaminase